MRVYPRGSKFDLTDDNGHLIEAGFDTEASALARAERWQASRDQANRRSSSPEKSGLPASVLLDVPRGRSWFVTRIKGMGWEVEEHRVASTVTGTDTLNAKDETRLHQCGSEGEVNRFRRSLADQGLFDRGVEG